MKRSSTPSPFRIRWRSAAPGREWRRYEANQPGRVDRSRPREAPPDRLAKCV
jgi:hypothetical protein